MQPLVLDTNVVLDLTVFSDPRTQAVREGLDARRYDWLATAEMREELRRVLDYPQFVRRQVQAQQVLAYFDQRARLLPVAPKAPFTCKDPDDQKFIDLAVAHRALLLSKDAQVLRLRKRLATIEVETRAP